MKIFISILFLLVSQIAQAITGNYTAPSTNALFEIKMVNGTTTNYCSAIRQSGNALVTAAHCLDRIVIGQTNVYVKNKDHAFAKISSMIKKYHPDWHGDYHNGSDMAVLYANGFGTWAFTQIVPALPQEIQAMSPFGLVRLMGYGCSVTHTLTGAHTARRGESPMLPRFDLQWPNSGMPMNPQQDMVWLQGDDTTSRIVAGPMFTYMKSGVGMCEGDSGGPVFSKDNATGGWMFVGIMSYFNDGSDYGYPNETAETVFSLWNPYKLNY